MREIKKQSEKVNKINGLERITRFHELSIVIPGMLILIMMANVFQW